MAKDREEEKRKGREAGRGGMKDGMVGSAIWVRAKRERGKRGRG